MTSIKEFAIHSNDYLKPLYHLNYRIGDFVKIKNIGETYGLYRKAFKHFTGQTNTPFYCKSSNYDKCRGILFKIKGMGFHELFHDLLLYIEDRNKQGCVISINGVELVKQLPLRKGESTKIVVSRIK